MTVIYAIILFVILIFPHELGHFVMAKAVGVKVNEFAFGMGPALFKKQKGETLYAIRAIPIGGYCAMEGENEESDNSRAFNNKPGWAKILVLVAGSAMNVIIAIVVLSIMMGYVGTATTYIDQVTKDSPAYMAGIQSGDKIASVDGTKINTWQDMSNVMGADSNEVNIEIERGDKSISLTAKPVKGQDGRYIIGVMPKVSHNVVDAVKNGGKATWNMTTAMFDGLKMLITGKASTNDITGPVGMISLVNDTNKYGLWYFGQLIALISLNLAIINMLPLPALDGGRILFVFIRKITGRMISDDLEGKVHSAGMLLLFAFMIFITWNDITRLLL